MTDIEAVKNSLKQRIIIYDSAEGKGWSIHRAIATTVSDLLYANKELLHQKVANYEDLRKEMQSTFYPERKPEDKGNSQPEPPFDDVALGELFHKLLDELDAISV